MTFADRLKEWRSVRRLTQADAAGLVGVPLRTWQGWEAGRPAALESMIIRMLELLP